MRLENFQELLTEFLFLNEGGRCANSNPEYFRAGFELLVNVAPYHIPERDERAYIVACMIYAHDEWADPTRRPFDFI